jgi:hypothetical protein
VRRADPVADGGAVTVELALALPAVVLVVGVLLVTLAVGGAQVRVSDAARTAARVAALGESDAEVAAAARRVLPGAQVRVQRADGWVTVDVSASVPGGWFSAESFGVRSNAVAWAEVQP